MKINRCASLLVLAAGVAMATFGFAGAAQAQDVFWSVGVASPGVQVGVTNARPVYAQPVYVQPQPVYLQAQQVYAAPQPVMYRQPAPVYLAPPQYIRTDWRYPGYRHGWQNGHGRHEHERFESGRFEGERSGRNHQEHRRD